MKILYLLLSMTPLPTPLYPGVLPAIDAVVFADAANFRPTIVSTPLAPRACGGCEITLLGLFPNSPQRRQPGLLVFFRVGRIPLARRGYGLAGYAVVMLWMPLRGARYHQHALVAADTAGIHHWNLW